MRVSTNFLHQLFAMLNAFASSAVVQCSLNSSIFHLIDTIYSIFLLLFNTAVHVKLVYKKNLKKKYKRVDIFIIKQLHYCTNADHYANYVNVSSNRN